MTDAGEVDRLRARVAELEAQVDKTEPPEPEAVAGHGHTRSVVAAVLIVLACVLAPLSVVAVWANTQVSDTDRYVQTVAPLVDDPGVQKAVADQVTTAILDNLNVQTTVTDALDTIAGQPNVPPRVAAALPGLVVPITNGVESFTRDQVGKIVASPQFATVWEQANRVAHAQLVKLLEGNQGGAVSAQGNTVTLNLAPIIAQVKDRLVAAGFGLAANIPTINKSFVLVQSDAVTNAQGIYNLLETLGLWLPIITLVLFAGGVLLARDRRRALARSGFGLTGAMLVLGVGLAVARVFYLDSVPTDTLPQDAAGSVFDTLVRFLRYGLRAVAVLGLVVGLGAYFTGPSRAAVRTREALGGGIGRARGGAESAGLNTGAFGAWMFAHKRALRIGTVIAGALVLVFWSRPTGAVVLWLAVAVLAVLGLIEFLARPPVVPAGAPGGTAGEPPTLPRQMERRSTPEAPAEGGTEQEQPSEPTPRG